MANTKLMKVMEYLINEQEDKARDLLHQIFIEKARAIHEEMMTDEDMDETQMGGDMGDHLRDDLKEIEAEEHYDEDTDMAEDAVEDLGDDLEVSDEDHDDMDNDMEDHDDMDMGDHDDDMDADTDEDEVEVEMGDEDHDEDMEDKIQDLEAAIEELKAEFEAMQQGEEHEEEHAEAPEADAHEDEVEEAWEADDDLDEEYDDLAEGMDLDQVQAPKSGEVGSGKFARTGASEKSPVAKTRPDMGVKAVVTGKGAKHTGFDREAAPASKDIGGGTGRRKDADQYRSHVSKEGDASAKLNKDRSEGFGAPNTKSPISGR